MIRPSRKLKDLRSSLKNATDLLSLIIEEQSDDQSPEELISASVDDPGNNYSHLFSSPPLEGEKVLLSVGQVMTDYLTAYGQFLDFFDAIRTKWPQKADQVGRYAYRYQPSRFFHDYGWRYGDAAKVLMANLRGDLTKSFDQWNHETMPRIPASDFGDLMCEYRDFLAFGRSAIELNDDLTKTVDRAASTARDSFHRLNTIVRAFGDPDEVARQMRRYAGHEYLLRDVHYSDDNTSDLRDLVLEMASFGERNNFMVDMDGLIGQTIDQDVGGDLPSRIIRVLEGLGRILQDHDYEGLGPVIDDWGGMDGFGSVNVIPGSGRGGQCQEILLAMASGGGASSGSLQDVMRRVRGHLIRCSDKTRVVIILTDHWDASVLRESKADITGHRKNGVVFISGLVSGPNITAQPLPY